MSGQVRPGRAPSPQTSDPCPSLLGLPDLTRQDTTRPDILGHILGHLKSPIGVHHPGTSKPPTAFPLVGGPSSVSTQSAPEGIRTPNLLIRSNSIDPTPTEAARPQTKPRQMFAQVTGVRTRQGGPGRDVTEPRSAEFWVTFWVTAAGSGEPGCGRYAPQLGAVNVDMAPCVRRR